MGTAMMKLVLLCALVAFSAAEGLKTVTIDGGEQIITLSTGSSGCAQAKAGDKLTMHYTGTIDPNSATGVKGSKFDSSLDRNEPFKFTLGAGEVIQGWDKGLVGICAGEKRKLVIPPAMGYGAAGAGAAIPGGATLDFTVECLKVNYGVRRG